MHGELFAAASYSVITVLAFLLLPRRGFTMLGAVLVS
jgi:hypothetical protein